MHTSWLSPSGDLFSSGSLVSLLSYVLHLCKGSCVASNGLVRVLMLLLVSVGCCKLGACVMLRVVVCVVLCVCEVMFVRVWGGACCVVCARLAGPAGSQRAVPARSGSNHFSLTVVVLAVEPSAADGPAAAIRCGAAPQATQPQDTPAPDICSVLARMQQLQQRLNRAKKGNTYQHVTGRAGLKGKHLAPGDSASRVAAAATSGQRALNCVLGC
jgi:hypothetical protein